MIILESFCISVALISSPETILSIKGDTILPPDMLPKYSMSITTGDTSKGNDCITFIDENIPLPVMPSGITSFNRFRQFIICTPFIIFPIIGIFRFLLCVFKFYFIVFPCRRKVNRNRSTKH